MTARHPYSAALVTGGAVRIGRAISLSLARAGLAVAVHHRNSSEEAARLVDEIRQSGGNACAITGDLGIPEDVTALVGTASEKLGKPLDVLVNNASVFENDTLADMTPDSWSLHQAVNLEAPVFLSQALMKQLSQNQKGCIVNIIDQRVLKLNPQYFSYTASKAGLWTVTRTMAQSLAPTVRVNAISPGPTLANQFQSGRDFEKEASRVMLRQGPDVSEITGAVQFLLETPSVTGQMITLDGGQHLAWRTEDIIED